MSVTIVGEDVDDELGHVHPCHGGIWPFYVAEHLSGCDGAHASVSSREQSLVGSYLHVLEVRLPAKDPK